MFWSKLESEWATLRPATIGRDDALVACGPRYCFDLLLQVLVMHWLPVDPDTVSTCYYRSWWCLGCLWTQILFRPATTGRDDALVACGPRYCFDLLLQVVMMPWLPVDPDTVSTCYYRSWWCLGCLWTQILFRPATTGRDDALVACGPRYCFDLLLQVVMMPWLPVDPDTVSTCYYRSWWCLGCLWTQILFRPATTGRDDALVACGPRYCFDLLLQVLMMPWLPVDPDTVSICYYRSWWCLGCLWTQILFRSATTGLDDALVACGPRYCFDLLLQVVMMHWLPVDPDTVSTCYYRSWWCIGCLWTQILFRPATTGRDDALVACGPRYCFDLLLQVVMMPWLPVDPDTVSTCYYRSWWCLGCLWTQILFRPATTGLDDALVACGPRYCFDLLLQVVMMPWLPVDPDTVSICYYRSWWCLGCLWTQILFRPATTGRDDALVACGPIYCFDLLLQVLVMHWLPVVPDTVSTCYYRSWWCIGCLWTQILFRPATTGRDDALVACGPRYCFDLLLQVVMMHWLPVDPDTVSTCYYRSWWCLGCLWTQILFRPATTGRDDALVACGPRYCFDLLLMMHWLPVDPDTVSTCYYRSWWCIGCLWTQILFRPATTGRDDALVACGPRYSF